jgi:uncharacterized LabA/DUF88 family protein
MKTRIFIDFWNFQLSLRGNTMAGYKLDWMKLSPLLIDTASNLIGQQLTFEETFVYLSHNPKNKADRSLLNWATNVLDRFPGVHVKIFERKPKFAPICQNCHRPISRCPHCGEATAGTIEKGVDTAIVTDLLGLAWESAWQIAILISSDRDFIPAIQMLAVKGFRVINASVPPLGMDLARSCWAHIDIRSILPALERKP